MYMLARVAADLRLSEVVDMPNYAVACSLLLSIFVGAPSYLYCMYRMRDGLGWKETLPLPAISNMPIYQRETQERQQ